jgi:hypothetical protein
MNEDRATYDGERSVYLIQMTGKFVAQHARMPVSVTGTPHATSIALIVDAATLEVLSASLSDDVKDLSRLGEVHHVS